MEKICTNRGPTQHHDVRQHGDALTQRPVTTATTVFSLTGMDMPLRAATMKAAMKMGLSCAWYFHVRENGTFASGAGAALLSARHGASSNQHRQSRLPLQLDVRACVAVVHNFPDNCCHHIPSPHRQRPRRQWGLGTQAGPEAGSCSAGGRAPPTRGTPDAHQPPVPSQSTPGHQLALCPPPLPPTRQHRPHQRRSIPLRGSACAASSGSSCPLHAN